MTDGTHAAPPPPAEFSAGGAGVRAEGVSLIGEMPGSGYREPPALARRADGQTIQLTPLLYAVLSALDGERDEAGVAAVVSEATGRSVNADNVAQLVAKLRELGLVAKADGSQPELQRANPLLGLRMKVAVSDEARTRRLIAPFAFLFNPLAVVPLVAAFGWIAWWILFDKGLASAAHDAFARPGLLLAVIGVTVLSAGFHEFGHAAACQRGGATPGVMGAGFYLIWPAFYTDVTDSYRLGRGGRLRTDLGGLYFNAIVTVASVLAWWATDYDAILLLVATQILQMIRQLMPLVRFDGYHVLADLTGVPDLFHRIGPTLKGLVPWLPRDERAAALKPWARAVVTLWVLVVIPVFAFTIWTLVLTLPRIVGTALASADAQRLQMLQAAHDGRTVEVLARGAAGLIVLLPIAATALILVRTGRRLLGSLWRRTRGRPVRRAISCVLVAGVVAALAGLWWPDDQRYRPIQAWEQGTLTQVASPLAARTGVEVGSQGTGTVLWPEGTPLPSYEHPQLAAVLVPVDSHGSVAPGTSPGSGSVSGQASQPWIFPFNQPLAPDAGDNQALAVNTTDNTATYAVAFAMVWADGSQPAVNTNEAYALASCNNCAAVAVAFQVVFVVGQNTVAAPQNVSVAVNYNCVSCLTYSLAVQLFVTLDEPLSQSAMNQVAALWQQIMDYGANITNVPLDEIQAQLSAYEQQLLAIVESDQGPLTPDPKTTPSVDVSPSESGVPSSSPSAEYSSSSSASPSSSDGYPSSSTSTSPSPSSTSSSSPLAPTSAPASPVSASPSP